VLGLDVASFARSRSAARLGYMPENDAHIPGMNAVAFVAYCGSSPACRPADAMQRAHEVLYYVGPRGGPVPERGDLLSPG
jgi:ABC-2 type transport system ATP-binding protein